MNDNNQIIIYQVGDGKTRIEVKFTDETAWLSQQQMAELYQTSRSNVVEHIRHIYDEGELDETSTCRKFRQARQEGKRQVSRDIPFYNLDMYMSDYVQQLDGILSSTGETLLNGAGSISHKQAMEKAEQEYRLFQIRELSPVERAYLDTIKTLNAKANTNPGLS